MIKLEIEIEEFKGIAAETHVTLKVPPTKWEQEAKERILDFCMSLEPDHAIQIKRTEIKYDNPIPDKPR